MKLRSITFLAFLAMSLNLMGSRTLLPAFSSGFAQKRQELEQIWKQGNYAKGLTDYRIAAENSRKAGFATDQLWFLHNLAGCQIGMFRFQSALKTMTQEKELAGQIRDKRILAVLGSNMSAIYEQLQNLPDAEIAAEEGLKYASFLEPVKQTLLYSQLGRIQAKQERLGLAEESFKRAIMIAQKSKDKNAEAWALDAQAYARVEAGKFAEAETAANASLELRMQPNVGGTDNSYTILGRVRAGQGDLKGAIALLDRAEEALDEPPSLMTPWLIYMYRGKIKNQAHDWQGALVDLRLARDSARQWRVDIPPSDADRTSSEEKLAELYQALVEAGNQLYLTTHDQSLIRETFEAAEENRAVSLRALLPQENDWRKRLPTHYYELLAQLQARQAAQMRSGASGSSANLDALRFELAQIEASVGGASRHQPTKALDQAQGALDEKSALFSFQLGQKGSWMWAVTKHGISLHQVPARPELDARVSALQRAARSNASDLTVSSTALYQGLFGSVAPEVTNLERWLLILDGSLFDLPFPALSARPGRFLIEDHSLQITPGALMLRSSGYRNPSHGGFLAVGDPIYNFADPRAKEVGLSLWQTQLLRLRSAQGPSFARLWGTAKEIEVSARAWNAPRSTLLTGKLVAPDIFWNNTNNKPEIIHIATHILEDSEKPKTGWIAFSLGGNGQIQYVTPEDILAKLVSARLVVLSGCSSGKADIQPATGLMGLTRAWIAAGAGGVLATRWPTVDDDGAFFESFYRHLRQSQPINPSEALRQASIEMLGSGNWRANPSFWAGYFLTGNY